MGSLPWHMMYECIFFHICAANHCSPSVLLHTMCQVQLLANAFGLAPAVLSTWPRKAAGGCSAAWRQGVHPSHWAAHQGGGISLSFISMALPRAEAMLLIRHNTVAHRTEENSTICTNQCCQGSLEKGKKTYPQCAHYLWLASLNSKIIANLVHWASKKLRNFDSQLEEPVTPKLACYTSIPFMRVSVMAFLNYFEEELTVCRAASKTGSVLNWRVLQYHILN